MIMYNKYQCPTCQILVFVKEDLVLKLKRIRCPLGHKFKIPKNVEELLLIIKELKRDKQILNSKFGNILEALDNRHFTSKEAEQKIREILND